ncbi:CHAT domain-containing protein [Streptomyces sp. NPDC087844]|uniref:CHAT domain-containing protein n=1 Tax=Streptomyces sp. NPDC087844 TaxID=3365805 RepID=UPI003824B68D
MPGAHRPRRRPGDGPGQAAGRSVPHLATHGDIQELTPYLIPQPPGARRSGPPRRGRPAEPGPHSRPPRAVRLRDRPGTATAGGEVLGLTRTAVISGARHAVVSLWPVDDVTGCPVITRMYRHLTSADRVTVGTALARAQREVRGAAPEEREEEYARLAEGADVPAGRTGRRVRVRDSGPRLVAAVTDRHHPFHWASFIHVGV